MLRRHFAGSLTALSTALLVLAQPLAAQGGDEAKPPEAKGADEADPVDKVQQLNRTAMQYFDDLNYAMAEKTLLEALTIVEKANLSNGPAGLATNGNLAVLYSVGLGKPDKAVFHFKKALAIKPDLKLSRQRTSPETEANLARAKAELAAGGPAAAPGPGPAAPKSAELAGEASGAGDFRCPVGGEVNAGDEITLRCMTASNLQPATVMLYYKVSAAPEFEVARMSKEGTSGDSTAWVAKIPAPRTQGTSLLFYFEANDPSGNTLAQAGSEESPNTIAVKGGEAALGAGPPPVDEEEGEEEEEEEWDDEEIDDDNPLAILERERWREHEGSRGSWWISLGVGSGLGYAAGHDTEAFHKYGVGFNPGIAPATTGQAVLEFGYFVGRQTALAITSRDQGIFGGLPGTATGAHSVLLRALFFTEDSGKLRWYFALAGGGGEGFRLQVTADVRDADGNPTGQKVKDTVRGGPFLAGIGGGMHYKLARRWQWTLDTQMLLGIPKTSAVLDLTTGIRWQY
jgi:tetratricopeptide (TPR) repeat protein